MRSISGLAVLSVGLCLCLCLCVRRAAVFLHVSHKQTGARTYEHKHNLARTHARTCTHPFNFSTCSTGSPAFWLCVCVCVCAWVRGCVRARMFGRLSACERHAKRPPHDAHTTDTDPHTDRHRERDTHTHRRTHRHTHTDRQGIHEADRHSHRQKISCEP